jgi:hypothetical protein
MVQVGLLDMCWRRSWFRYISRWRYTGNKEEVFDGFCKVTQIQFFSQHCYWEEKKVSN